MIPVAPPTDPPDPPDPAPLPPKAKAAICQQGGCGMPADRLDPKDERNYCPRHGAATGGTKEHG
jgi:hypothetical protein